MDFWSTRRGTGVALLSLVKIQWQQVGVLSVFVACIPLFAVDHHFFGDWHTHLAMVGYVGEHLRTHLTAPLVFHTNETIGRPTPLFYGNFFCPSSAPSAP